MQNLLQEFLKQSSLIFLGFLFLVFLILPQNSEISAHEIIPEDIMNEILANENITDEEIEALFQSKYQMTGEEYTEKKEQEYEEGMRDSLAGDPEYDEYLRQQYENAEKTQKKTEELKKLERIIGDTATIIKTGNQTNSTVFSGFFENIQILEQKKIVEIRKNLKQNSEDNQDSRDELQFVPTSKNIKPSISAGILHIWGGIDHILFFLTLLLVLRPFKQTLLIISAFTLAHSLTLLLVGSGALLVNTQLIEIIIAISIVYSAVFAGIQLLNKNHKNVHDDFKHTLCIVFIFGLFHGMGFAEVFNSFTIEFSEYWGALVLYNIGIEIGQILLLFLFFPAVYFLHKKNWGQKFLILSSFIIATLAVIWVFERV